MNPTRIALVVVSVTLAGATFAVPARGVTPADGRYYLQNVATGWNAAASADTAVQRRPRGDEDRQQWLLRADADAYLLENTDLPGRCLGRAGAVAAVLDCTAPDARWQLDAGEGEQGYAVRAPGTQDHLRTDGAADRLTVGPGGAAARWYLTPLMLPTGPAPADPRLDEVTFLTAHNAFANGRDGGFAPPVLDLFPNQVRGVEQQLADGVRGLMFDVHQTSDGAILCHQSCALVRRPVALSTALRRVVDFLRRDPAAVVTVFLEDYVDAAVLRAELAKVPGLDDLLFRPGPAGVRENGWPRVSELRQRGTRLLLFTDHSRAQDAAAGLTRDSFGVSYQREWTVENHWSMGGGVGGSDWSCYSRWGTELPLTRTEPGFRRLFVMNHFRDTPVPATIGTDNGKLLDRARRFCEPAARAKPNFLAVDRYDLGDPDTAVEALNGYAVTTRPGPTLR